MQIFSFIRQEGELVPVEVEISLSPGLPQLHCLGLPDQHIRESTHRIRSALKNQGFQFPKGRQVLVNLRPSQVKKTSQGLEFAIAAGILWQTGQIAMPPSGEPQWLYGELSLHGEVFEPGDLLCYQGQLPQPLWTGSSVSDCEFSSPRIRFARLADLRSKGERVEAIEAPQPERPEEWLDISVSEEQAQLLSLIALGEHPSLFLGPSGSGKTTMAQALSSLLSAPTTKEFQKLRARARRYGEYLRWRPVIKPHHTATVSAMVGGGAIPGAGEVARADGGLLVLDEFFEFSSKALDALREPIEEGQLRLARAGRVRCFPCRCLIIGTANLCPCGDWAPGVGTNCSYSLRRCRSYMERMSGPLLDRFQIIAFSQGWRRDSSVSLRDLMNQLEEVRRWKQSLGRGASLPNARISAEEALRGLDEFSRSELLPRFGSVRRELATYRVARTLADLAQERDLRLPHIESALRWTVNPWASLKNWM